VVDHVNTTISISTDIRDEIKEFGQKGETYDDILKRILESAKQRQLHDLLMDETGTVPVRKALQRAKKRWPK